MPGEIRRLTSYTQFNDGEEAYLLGLLREPIWCTVLKTDENYLSVKYTDNSGNVRTPIFTRDKIYEMVAFRKNHHGLEVLAGDLAFKTLVTLGNLD